MTTTTSFDLDGVTLHFLSDGRFRLDGGAMFGVVPRVLWERVAPADPEHRIDLGLRPLLIRSGGKNVLVDTGLGGKWDEKGVSMYAIDRRETLLSSLAAAGLAPSDVDVVVLTHLHFDHAGGATLRNARGDVVPTFPRARHVIQRREWEEARDRSHLRRASYRPEDFLPLEAAGLVDLVEGVVEVAQGVETVVTGGHTEAHQAVRVRSGGRTAVYWGDLIPTTHHVPHPWIMGYDVLPAQTYAAKRRFEEEALAGGWLCLWDHDPATPASYLVRGEDGRIRATSAV
ncbi:MAG: MBL fold metallo-hydrolase [Planctomycetes bacterium]|nr:MBL fold metallo-hydrolase [Planctomycetota bacterium]